MNKVFQRPTRSAVSSDKLDLDLHTNETWPRIHLMRRTYLQVTLHYSIYSVRQLSYINSYITAAQNRPHFFKLVKIMYAITHYARHLRDGKTTSTWNTVIQLSLNFTKRGWAPAEMYNTFLSKTHVVTFDTVRTPLTCWHLIDLNFAHKLYTFLR